MKHPADFETIPCGAAHIVICEAGTTVRNDRTGEEILIDDDTFALKGSVIFCTQAVVDRMRIKFPEAF